MQRTTPAGMQRMTHDAQRTTHDARRTTHDARSVNPSRKPGWIFWIYQTGALLLCAEFLIRATATFAGLFPVPLVYEIPRCQVRIQNTVGLGQFEARQPSMSRTSN